MTHDVLVIGAGVSGLSVAWALLKRGHQVVLLDRGHVGAESSWAGGGILSPLLPWDYPAPLLSLALPSMAGYEEWVRQVEMTSGLDAEYWRCGMHVLDPTALQAELDWCRSHGLEAEAALWGETHRALWLSNIAQVRNPRLLAALAAAVQKAGGSIRTECAVEEVTVHGRRLIAVRGPRGDFAASSVVLATGAWAGLGLTSDGSLATSVPNIRPIRGQMLLFKVEPGVLETILYRSGLYVIPRRDGHILVGSTLEDVGFDKSTDEETRRRLHAEAAELLPALADVQPIRHWAGLRPGSPDNIPVIDRHPDFDNVYVNVGHYRYGVTLAPASAELLADLMEDKTPGVDPAPYRWQAVMERRWSDGLPGA